jgi:hypothetical protein
MRNRADIEAYLMRMHRSFEDVDQATLVLHSSGVPVVVRIDPPLVLVQLTVGSVPEKQREAFFLKLLTLNATECVHLAFGITDNVNVVLNAALALENLDFNELESVLTEIDLAVAHRLPQLKTFAQSLS